MGKQIIKYHNPSIILDELKIIDYKYGQDNSDLKNETNRFENVVGTLSPYIQMNGMKYSGNLIEFMELTIGEDLLPTLSFSFREMGGQFISRHYPRDGDVISLYLAPNNDEYKPIRMDFTAIAIQSPLSTNPSGNNMIFSCEAILRIPSIYGEFSECYDGTSFEVLKELSDLLKLGFCSNTTNTNDKMCWINPYDTRKNFIHDIITHSYIDDRSFNTCFVDQYYYMNFININDLLVIEDNINTSISNQIIESEYRFNDTFIEKFESLMYLTNSRIKANEPNYIKGFTLISDNGQITLGDGYKKYIQYYDKKTKKYVEYFIEPMDTDGVNPSSVLRGRVDEDKNDQIKYEYLGVQSENVHDNYLHSSIQNMQNFSHISRMRLEVELSTINQSISMGTIIPIFIIYDDNEFTRETNFDDPDDGDENKQGTMSIFLSGWYVVSKIRYIWDKSSEKLTQVLTCIKREWENMGEIREQMIRDQES